MFIKEYLKPIREMQILEEADQEMLFSNIESLYKTNQVFFKELRLRQSEEEIVQCIGDVISKQFEAFEVYALYCQNQYAAKLAYNSKMSEPTVFNEFVKSKANRSRRLDFWSFLDAPRRRIAKYPLLIKSLLECTPQDHADYQNMKEAYKVVDRVVASLNENEETMDTVSTLPPLFNNGNSSGLLRPVGSSLSINRSNAIQRNTSILSLAASVSSICTINPQIAQRLLSLQQLVKDSSHKELTQAIMKSKELFHEGMIIDMKKNRVVLAILVDRGLVLLKREKQNKLTEVTPKQFTRLFIKVKNHH
jgi:hypothetical protein